LGEAKRNDRRVGAQLAVEIELLLRLLQALGLLQAAAPPTRRNTAFPSRSIRTIQR
jgi:hypothetical protein